MRRYSEAMKADVRRRMSPPNRQSMARISEETGIHAATLYLWGSATTSLLGISSHQKATNPIRRYHLSKPPEKQPRSDTLPESHRGRVIMSVGQTAGAVKPRRLHVLTFSHD